MKNKKKILFIASEPIDSSSVKATVEFKTINKVFKESSRFKNFKLLNPEFHVNPDDFSNAIIKNDPWLIHYCGHGYEGGDWVLEKKNREKFIVNSTDLLELVGNLKNLECFFFCSCFSDELAKEAMKVVDYVIGFEGIVKNDVAIDFAKKFYQNFSVVKEVPRAFKITLNQLTFKGTPRFKSVFKTQNQYIMNEIILKKNYAITEGLTKKKAREIEKIKNEIESLSDEKKTLFQKLILENPYPEIVLWFKSNRVDLSQKLAKLVLSEFNLEQQQRFANELKILFIFLETTLTNFDYRNFNKEDINKVPRNFKKAFYLEAFSELVKIIPSNEYSKEQIAFLKDNLRFIKELIH